MAETKTDRTCANCGCAAEIKHPVEVGRSQWVCRKNGLFVVDVPNRGPMLTYPPTTAEGVCFKSWRPLGTLPGENWRQEGMMRAVMPLLADALKQAGIDAKLSRAIGSAMCDSAIAAGMFAVPPDSEKD